VALKPDPAMKLTKGEKWAFGLALAAILGVLPFLINSAPLLALWIGVLALVTGTVVAVRQQRRTDRPFADWLRSRSVSRSIDHLRNEGQDRPHIAGRQNGGSGSLRQRLLSRRPRSGD
jgi:hypothetical protein